jgi:hypothetical protein
VRRQVVSLLAGILGLLVLAPPALADGGRIGGRVLGGPEASVLADARVELHRFEPGTGSWQSQAVIRTDANGRYRFTGLTAGRYRVCAQSDEGVGSPNPERLYLPRCWRAAPTVDTADEIVLDPASMAASASIRLPRRGQVRGHVTDPEGDSVTGGYAQAFWDESGRWVPGPYALFDGDGNYELRLDSGRVYRVCFYPGRARAREPVLERRAHPSGRRRNPRRGSEPRDRWNRRAAPHRRPDRGSDPRIPDRHSGLDRDPGASPG